MWEYHAGSVTSLILAAEFVIKPSTFILNEHMEICTLIPDRSQKLPYLNNNNISKNISLNIYFSHCFNILFQRLFLLYKHNILYSYGRLGKTGVVIDSLFYS